MKNKLHIPAPEEEGYLGTEIMIGVCIVVFFLMGYFFLRKSPDDGDTIIKDENSEVQILLKTEKALSRRFQKFSEDKLADHEWTSKDLHAVFSFGPSNAAEVACEEQIEAMQTGNFPKELAQEIEKAVARRVNFAPWRCLTEGLLNSTLPEGKLKQEMESFFVELESIKGNEEIVVQMLDYYRENRIRLKNDRFYRWLRRCGTHATYKGAVACRRFLKTLSPKYGRDVLESLQQSLSSDAPKDEDHQEAIATLGLWIRHGQPKSWKVKTSKNLPAYDIDFRIGAILSLCRFTMSEGGVLRQQAIDELAKSAEVQMRANPEIQAQRWMTTCDLMFGGRYQDERTSNVLLTRKAEEDTPSYDINFLIDNNYCAQKPGYPTWYCAVEKWIHGDTRIQSAMASSFIETRFMEFSEFE